MKVEHIAVHYRFIQDLRLKLFMADNDVDCSDESVEYITIWFLIARFPGVY